MQQEQSLLPSTEAVLSEGQLRRSWQTAMSSLEGMIPVRPRLRQSPLVQGAC